ncbi:hypothetical protein SAMN05421797_10216 [Maribacter ulvicola]|uniref:Uncharacterized protein n=1 Tax=Maribacter ulvicola TaxID=228959 RepID=A0A1N6TLD8_9FLAO|nr:hypothetical protein SAMN05421797_10216 [Maribacter ulvicola]
MAVYEKVNNLAASLQSIKEDILLNFNASVGDVNRYYHWSLKLTLKTQTNIKFIHYQYFIPIIYRIDIKYYHILFLTYRYKFGLLL